MSDYQQIYDDAVNQTLYAYDETRRLIDPDTTEGLQQVRQAMIDTYTPNKLLAQQSFHGVCLRQLDTVVIEDGEAAGQTRLRIKARIPEIHSFLPIPTGPEDYMTLAFYPTFISPAGAVDAGTITAGSPVQVSFGNMANFADPTFEGVFSIGTGGGVPGQPGSRRAHTGGRRAEIYENQPGGQISIVPVDVNDNLASWIKKEPQFKTRKRLKNVINTIVVHQSCTTSRKSMVNVLLTRRCVDKVTKVEKCPSGLGTHFSVDHKGKVVQYVDLDRISTHAGNVNPRSIGIDMVVQCTWDWRGKKIKKAKPDDARTEANRGYLPNIINNPAKQYLKGYPFGSVRGKEFVIANGAAMSSMYNLIALLRKKEPTIELKFPCVSAQGFKIGFIGEAQTGIVAHANVSSNKGDGYATTFYLYLRLIKGYDHQKAYAKVLQTWWAQQKHYTETGKKPSRYIKV